jgi:hypothetical protein
MRLDIILKDIQDVYIRENFLRLRKYLIDKVLLRGDWQFFEITVSSGVTGFKFKHNLGFQPYDIIQTAVSNSATVTWNYDNFDSEFVDLDTSGACTIRCYIGSYREETT